VSSRTSAETEQTGSRARALIRGAWIAVAVLVAIVALGIGAERVTASASICNVCHEMKPAVASWRVSGHTQVGCPECHETPRPWYRFPETLAERSAMLRRDIAAHYAGADGDTITPSAAAVVAIPDETCTQCHDPGRTITMRFGTLIDHREHAERNGSCVSCHLWTAHPDPEAERPLLMMRQCFACHGRSAGAKAPGTCDACHPPSFEKRPVSHAPANWATTHGEPAKSDPGHCLMCHEQSACDSCHGLEMPHPTTWADGETGHGVVASEGRATCTKCHEGGLGFCSMCHHPGYDASTGPWVAQHSSAVQERGALFCIECHGPVYCVECHTRSAS